MPSLHALPKMLLPVLCALVACPETSRETDAGPPHVSSGASGAVPGADRGFLVWESNRSGSWRIWTRPLEGGGPRQISPEEPGRDHFSPHISPDGSRVAYLSYPEESSSYDEPRAESPVELRVIRVADGEQRTVTRDARSYGESRAVVWIDGHRLLHLSRDGATWERDLQTGDATLVASAPKGRGPYLLNTSRTHGTSNDPTFSPYDPTTRTLTPAPRRGGCQGYFTRDGRFGFWVAAAGGPIQRVDLARGRSATMIARDDPRLPEAFRYVYFPMVSANQRLLAWAASGGDHDHFRADYEIFVAPIDPMTLELAGTPRRYTFDPGTDRFPDVFVTGLELGHRVGEAPFPVVVDPSHLGPEQEPGEPWRWDFGDGATADGPVGRHTYQSPGVFTLVARRGERELRARIDVEPAAPPKVRRTRAGVDAVDVLFDEAIEVDAVAATLASGIPVTEVSRKADRRTLHLRTGAELPAADRLRLEGVRDVAGHVASALTLDVERTSWPADDEGLAFRFGTGADDDALRDSRTGEEIRHPLVAQGRARFDHHHALLLTGGSFEVRGAAEALGHACSRAGAITLEALIRPAAALQSGSRTILRLDDGGGRKLLELAHRRDQILLRLRTGSSDPKIPVATFTSTDPIYLSVSYREGRLVARHDGQKAVDTDRVDGDLGLLAEAEHLRFGGDPQDGSDWQGALEGIAIYCRALGANEATANAASYRTLVAEREAVPRHRVRAQLIAASEAPAPEAIVPYREALVVYEWEVLRVLDGELGAPRIRVAHWAVLGGERQPVPPDRPGAKRRLELELLSDNPQVASLPLVEHLEPDPDVPLFLDVGT